MDTQAWVNYHLQKSTPQAFHFDAEGVEGNLLSPELIATQVKVRDMRTQLDQLDFNRDGIQYASMPTVIDFSCNGMWQTAYEAEIVALLTECIGATQVKVFDHTIRIDDGTASRKPARNVHNDFSPRSAEQRLVDLLGETLAAEYQQGHFGFVNVWRPIERPVRTSPLGFVKPSSMAKQDWINIELIYSDRQGQILGALANPQHEWFYVSEMLPNEVAIFNVFDNQQRPYLAHSALDLIDDKQVDDVRKSIETRVLVRYD